MLKAPAVGCILILGKSGKIITVKHYKVYIRWVLPVLALVLFLYSIANASSAATIEQGLSALERKTGAFTFAVIGDNRSGDDVYKKIVGMVMARRPDFVVNVGDQIPSAGNLSDWKNFRKLSAPITVPYFLTVGNHDVAGKESEEIYKKQADLPGNGLYYSFSCGNSLFIVLDSYLAGQTKSITGEQYDWLEKLLETTDKRHKFVFVHHPLNPDRLSFTGSLASHTKERDRLMRLLVKHKISAVFAGHLHLYLRKIFNGLTQIITGGAGAPLLADDQEGGFFHFVLMTVDGDKVSGEVIDIDGNVKDRFVLDGQE